MSSQSGRLLVSFSGGRSSARMLDLLLATRDRRELIVVFENTSQEHEQTLRFVDRVDREWGANIVWLEAVVGHGKGAGTRHRVVSFEAASRDGSVFESVIAKYGIPNRNYPGQCTRELKLNPLRSYLRSIGWGPGTYDTAIGIRADEVDRMSKHHKEDRLVYPLIKAGIRKPDVRQWWSKQSFDLDLPEHLGNCTWCWKKSQRKHLTLVKECPEIFDFPSRMERDYADAGAGVGRRVFFRGGLSTADLFKLADSPFVPFSEKLESEQSTQRQMLLPIDMPDGCADSCEIDFRAAE